MRHLFTGLVAAVAVMAAAPAFACGYNPCGASVYVAPAPVVDYGCTPCGGWAHERLAAPEQQYYYVNQGPTYTGPGNFAPVRTYEEGSVSGYGYGYHRPHYGYRHHYGYRPHYGYRHYGTYAPRGYYHASRMGYHQSYSPYYGRHVLRRYY
jgi:hypothetical protein